MINNIPRSRIDEELYLVLRTIFHYERSIIARYGLDFQQIYAMQFLRHGRFSRLTEIASELELPMFTTSRMIDKLAASGYVRKEQDAQDRRNLHIHLEPKGEEILKAIEDSSYNRILKNIESLEPEEVSEFLSLADKLHVVLGVTERVLKSQ